MIDTDLPIVALVGQANVGKSTLLNAVAGYGRAIVAREAHTTRDTVDVVTEHRGQHFRLVDTPGVDSARSQLSRATTQSRHQTLDRASVIVLVVDRSLPVSQADLNLVRQLRRYQKPLVLALNKSDKLRLSRPAAEFRSLGIDRLVEVSAINRAGITSLVEVATGFLGRAVAPRTTSRPPTRVALIGRPNVGKSSLFNRLVGRGRSIISEDAGTTRDAVYQLVRVGETRFELADTAGLRRPGRIGVGIERFSASRTRHTVAWADVVILVLDAQELATNQDQHLAGEVIEAGRGLILAVNKLDLLDTAAARANVLARLRAEFEFSWWAPAVLVSAATGKNTSQLLTQAAAISHTRQKTIETAKLNRVLGAATHEHPPATTGRGRAKLSYITQTDVSPPTFTIFGSRPSQVHFSYRRYLENRLRDQFDFSGTPIKLIFKDKQTS